jgi:regulator of sigma E protease
MNLKPLPPLDGGKIVLEIVERIIRRPIKPAVTVALNAAGSILLFALVGYIIFVDISRIVG